MNETKPNGRDILVGAYIAPPMLAELKAAAKKDHRSQSAYLLVLIEKDLAARRRRARRTRKAA